MYRCALRTAGPSTTRIPDAPLRMTILKIVMLRSGLQFKWRLGGRMIETEVIRAPRGTGLHTKGWQQEAALRMLMNNLDPEVAERPDDLVVYGGTGKAARNWECFHAIVRALKSIENDETLLIQSGKPVGILRTHEAAPRVLIANANLVGRWSNWEHFHELERKGLMMYGQMTAGSWIYIGSQGIVQGTYETFAEALAILDEAKLDGKALSVGLVANAADVLPELIRRNIVPNLLTDQTSAHDPLNGYVPNGMTLNEALELRRRDPEEYTRQSMRTMGEHVKSMLELKRRGAITFDYGNNLRAQAKLAGVEDAFEIPGFVPEYIRPLFCEGKGPFRWVALSGDPKDIYRTDQLVLELFPEDASLRRWIELAQKRIHFQGLPSRICWLGYGQRAKFGVAMNELVRKGEISAPIVIGRDHLDAGSVASPYRETEGMIDGSDAVADWPLLNALVNTAAGASWVSIHNGGGVGIGYSHHAGMVVVADGTDLAAQRLERVLATDPGTGVLRHVDAGYEQAIEFAKEKGIRIPMQEDRA